jgi:hypothetical protein
MGKLAKIVLAFVRHEHEHRPVASRVRIFCP